MKRRELVSVDQETWLALMKSGEDRHQRKLRERRQAYDQLAAAGLLARCRAVNGGESLLFREAGRPKVDFFPSTGAWRVAGVAETFQGGGVAFVAWYAKQGDQR